MANGIYTEIKKRIELAEPGTVFLTSDFTDIATTTTVRKCLGIRLSQRKCHSLIVKFFERLYEVLQAFPVICPMGTEDTVESILTVIGNPCKLSAVII